MKNIKNKEIAKYIGKTPSAVSYVKKYYPEEYEVIRLGALCKKLDIDENMLLYLYGNIHKIIKYSDLTKGDENEQCSE